MVRCRYLHTMAATRPRLRIQGVIDGKRKANDSKEDEEDGNVKQ